MEKKGNKISKTDKELKDIEEFKAKRGEAILKKFSATLKAIRADYYGNL